MGTAKLAGIPVKESNRVDGLKVVLANGSWCLVRPPGQSLYFAFMWKQPARRKKKIQQEVKTALCVPL